MASTRAVPLVTTGGVPLVIRAPLSTHDDTDSDISPVYSDASQNSFHSLSDEETVTVASASTVDASSVRFARIPSMPVAKITGDDETESTDEEEVEKDAFFGVAKVADLNGSEKPALEEGESSNNLEIPGTPDGMENESINTEYYSFNSDQDNFGTNEITNSQDLNEKIDASILSGNKEDLNEQITFISNGNKEGLHEEMDDSISSSNKEDLHEQQIEDSNQEISEFEPISTELEPKSVSNVGNMDLENLDDLNLNFNSNEEIGENLDDLNFNSNEEVGENLDDLNLNSNGEVGQNTNYKNPDDNLGFSDPSLNPTQNQEYSSMQSFNLQSSINTRTGSLDLGENHENLDPNANDLSNLGEVSCKKVDNLNHDSNKEVDNLNHNSNEEVGENGLSDVENLNNYSKPDYNLRFSTGIESQNNDKDLIFDEAADGESSISSAFSNSNLIEEEEEIVEFDPSALAAYIRQNTGASSDDTITINYKQNGPKLVSIDRAPPVNIPSLEFKSQIQIQDDLYSGYDADFLNFLNEEEKKIHEKVDLIRVLFIRLVYSLGLTLDEKIANDVLSRLTLAEGLRFKMPFNEGLILENAKNRALKLNQEGKDLNFSFKILLIGKIGVGKSALINSIFKNENKSSTNPFSNGTNQIEEIIDQVDGVNLHLMDTPGLHTSLMDQNFNKKIISSLKTQIKKSPPDAILYVDRVDTQTRNFNDLPVLRSITNILGQSIWSKVVKTLTHASSAPPEGPSGSQLDYEMFVTQRAHGIQQAIRMATRDPGVANPVALVENHFLCRKNIKGEMVLPNGLAWRPNLLLLCYSMKILSQANCLLNPNNHVVNNVSNGNGSGFNKGFGFVSRPLPLKYLISSLLESKGHLKLINGVVKLDSDDFIDLDLDLEGENEINEYDNLPPFKPLKKSQIEKLTKEQKKAYFEEYKYRVRLFEKKQRVNEIKRLKEEGDNSNGSNGSGSNGVASDSVQLHDMALPLSFDSECPLYRYRSLGPGQTGYRVQVRPLLDPLGWDHDCGYNGVSIDQNLAILNQFPSCTKLQLKKDKEEFNIHLDSSICVRHADVASTLTTFEIQPIGTQHLAYILNGETKIKTSERNLTTGGVSVIFLGNVIAPCWKVEDRVRISKQAGLSGSAGAVYAKDGGIFGCNLEARVKDSVAGLSLMKLRSEVSLGANLEMNFEGCLGDGSNLGVNLGVNSKGIGRIGVKVSSFENVQIGILGLVSIGVAIFNRLRNGVEYEE